MAGLRGVDRKMGGGGMLKNKTGEVGERVGGSRRENG